MAENQYLHEVAITAIICKDDRYLVIKRSPTKKRFPNMWTVPGGKLETSDYTDRPRDTEAYWYNILEYALQREVQEEVGIKIKNVDYLTSLATVHDDGAPSIVISCSAQYESGEIKLQEEEAVESRWVTTAEAAGLELIDGIYEEFVMFDERRSGRRTLWVRANR